MALTKEQSDRVIKMALKRRMDGLPPLVPRRQDVTPKATHPAPARRQ